MNKESFVWSNDKSQFKRCQMAKKTAPRYNEAEGKQKVARIYILDTTFYLLIVLCSHLGWVRCLASLWGRSRILNCFIGFQIACTVKFLALKAVLPKQSLFFLVQHARTKNSFSFFVRFFVTCTWVAAKGYFRLGLAFESLKVFLNSISLLIDIHSKSLLCLNS